MEQDFADSLEAQLIVDFVSTGQTLRAACKDVGVGYSTIYARMRESERFRELLEDARKVGFEAIAEQCLEIADDSSQDIVYTERGERMNGEFVQRSKLRVETRLKLLSKWHPNRYGEKLQVEQKSATIAIPVSDDPVEAQRAYEDLMRGG